MQDDSPLFFIHVPKTAGTSFRKGLEQALGNAALCYDYAEDAPETSDLVRQYLYRQQDPFRFSEAFEASDARVIAGHVPANKYIDLIGTRRTLTFLRDPVQRVISEYWHFVRHQGWQDSLEAFYRKPRFINRQSKMLQGVPLEALGFIGLTERYAQSLEQLNRCFGLTVENLALNSAPDKQAPAYELHSPQLEEVRRLNRQDIALYEQALQLFEQREAMCRKGLAYAHGAIQQAGVRRVSGWGWWAGASDEPLTVRVSRNNQPVGEARATLLRPALLRWGLPRSGYVGFHLEYQAQPGDMVCCEVADTGQRLGQVTVQSAAS